MAKLGLGDRASSNRGTTNNTYSVLGYRQNKEDCRVVLAKQDDEDSCIPIWANTGLRKVLQAAKQFVECAGISVYVSSVNGLPFLFVGCRYNTYLSFLRYS